MKPCISTALQRSAMTLLALPLCGCLATAQPDTYRWGSYQQQLWRHFKGEDPTAQIQALEADLQQTQARGDRVPPGVNAHLGLLYGQIGQDDRMAQGLQQEKALFPESTGFMDRLLSRMKGPKP
ncbi:hypothetical protein CAP38_01265 [Hydrogenophaga sp. IBVHS2]|nr:hypothetical protein CAP38_01265 [Hydrogenophaga sp. IBVHS2]